MKPIFEVTGKWITESGELIISSVHDRIFKDIILGHRIEKKAVDKGRATDGPCGQNGKMADQRNKKTTLLKNPMSFVTKPHLENVSAVDWQRPQEKKLKDFPAYEKAQQLAVELNITLETKKAEAQALQEEETKFATERNKLMDELSKVKVNAQVAREDFVLAHQKIQDLKKKEKYLKRKIAKKSELITNCEKSICQNSNSVVLKPEQELFQLDKERKLLMQTEHRIQEGIQQTQLTTKQKINSNNRTKRIVDEEDIAANYLDEDNQDDIITSFDPFRTVPSDPKSLSGVQLLDALIIKFSDNIENMLSLSFLAQSLQLRIQLPNLWESITFIIENQKTNPSNLIEHLEIINKDMELAEFLISGDERTKHILEKIREAVNCKILTGDVEVGVAELVCQFRKINWSCVELQGILKNLETLVSENFESNDSIELTRKLKLALAERLVYSLSNEPAVIATIDHNNRFCCQIRLNQCVQQCLVKDPSLSVGKFFDGLIEKLETERNNDTDSMSILNDFIQSKMEREIKPTNTTDSPDKNCLSDYFNHWIECQNQIQNIYDQIQLKWQNFITNKDKANEPKSMKCFEIIIGKYALITSWLLSPVESLDKWKSMEDINPEKLEEEIINVMTNFDDFPLVKTIMTSIDDAIDQLLKSKDNKPTDPTPKGNIDFKNKKIVFQY